MGKKRIGIILIISMIMTGLPWIDAYASDGDDILVENYDTEQVIDEEEQVIDSGRDDIVSETVKTTPVEEGEGEKERDLPDGVVKMTLKTTAVENEENDNKNDEIKEEEVTGTLSMPDPAELGIYNEDVINMVMPVIPEDMYDFVLDAQDLLSRFSIYKDAYERSSIYFTNAGEEITHSGISDVAIAKNKSSVPVLLYVTLQVENEYGWPVRYTQLEAVEDDEEKNLSFALIPVSVNRIEGDSDTEYENGENTEDEYVLLNDQRICVDEEGRAEMILYLDGSKDNFDIIGDKYMAKEDALWSNLGFAVTGACNTRADWKEMDGRTVEGESINIHISYRMDTLTEEQQAQIEEGLRPDPASGVIRFE